MNVEPFFIFGAIMREDIGNNHLGGMKDSCIHQKNNMEFGVCFYP